MAKKRNIEQELLEDLEEVKAHKRGKAELRTRTFTEASPSAVSRE